VVSQLIASAATTFLALFPITHPVGAIPIFYSLTANESPRAIRLQARQVAINATTILVIFFLSGRVVLQFFGLSLGVLQIAGGLLVGQTAWKMLVQPQFTSGDTQGGISKQDIAFFPMAVPLISGPGAIGLVIALATSNPHWESYLGGLLGIGGLGIILYLCLALGAPLIKAMGKSGTDAMSRILGFFVLAIGIQLISDGLFSVIQSSGLNH
jgi:multiple antibiotic resistance protein